MYILFVYDDRLDARRPGLSRNYHKDLDHIQKVIESTGYALGNNSAKQLLLGKVIGTEHLKFRLAKYT